MPRACLTARANLVLVAVNLLVLLGFIVLAAPDFRVEVGLWSRKLRDIGTALARHRLSMLPRQYWHDHGHFSQTSDEEVRELLARAQHDAANPLQEQ